MAQGEAPAAQVDRPGPTPGFSGHMGEDEATEGRSLSAFTVAFFATFGAHTEWLHTPGGPVLAVDLPQELQEHFGRPHLRLVFHNAEVTRETELVAYGSRLFDRMMDYLVHRGSATVLRLPVRHPGAEELLQGLRPRNGWIGDLRLRERTRLLCLFNWHIAYRADEKWEELVAVLVDQEGRRLGLWGAEGGPTVEREPFSPERLLADGQPMGPEAPGPPPLPPMAHLARLAREARKHALYYADVRSVEYEAAVLPRLHKVLARLTSYYQQQIQEIRADHDPDGTQRRHLAEDLERKVAEEVENHRLRVRVTLVSYALFHVPVAEARMRLEDGTQSVSVEVRLDRYTGVLEPPPCHACGTALDTAWLCRNGHLACDGCVETCAICARTVCRGCGIHRCPVCTRGHCDACSHLCWACGEQICPDHVGHCPVCRDPVCHGCQERCRACGVRQCRSHLVVDGVSGAYLCTDCAVRCPGCGDYVLEVDTCQVSGQRFCRRCGDACVRCGRWVGLGLTLPDEAGRPVCPHCLVTCSGCGQRVVHGLACRVCGQAGCEHCLSSCMTCGERLCPDHAPGCGVCGREVCERHALWVGDPAQRLCDACAAACAICGSGHALEDARTCAVCHESYGPCCVEGGVCHTCRELAARGEPVAILEEPVVQDPRVAHVAGRYRWVRAANRRVRLYLGRLPQDELGILPAVLVVAAGEKVHLVRRLLVRHLLGREGER